MLCPIVRMEVEKAHHVFSYPSLVSESALILAGTFANELTSE